MSEVSAPPWISKALQDLGLQEFYPGKLKKKHVIKIFPSDVDDNHKETKGITFLKNLLNCDARCRSVFDCSLTEDSAEVTDYPKAIAAIFMCADPLLRRYLVEKMQACQMAVPFILPSTKEILLWPLRIVRNWYGESSSVQVGCLASEPMPMLTMMQVGDSDECVGQTDLGVGSELLNGLFGEPGYKGFSEKVISPESDGYVEMAWYLPRGRKNDGFSGVFAAANLLGDASKSPDQVKYLLEVSSCVIFATESLDLVQDVLEDIEHNAKKVIVALMTQSRGNRWKRPGYPYAVIPIHHVDDIKKCTKMITKRFTWEVCSLEDRVSRAADFDMVEDEVLPACCKGKKLAENVMKSVSDATISVKLPYQEAWKEWARLDKDLVRRKNAMNANLVGDFIEKQTIKKQDIETFLSEHTRSICLEKFMSYLLSSSEEERMFFLEWLRYFLDERSRRISQTAQMELDMGGTDTYTLNRKSASEKQIGLEHFFREISIYWTVKSKREGKSSPHLQWLPRLVSLLLLDLYPLEILNGDSSYVPVEWVSEVFHELRERFEREVKVYVTSILGIQSSGKSTFLNTMFGISFAVSSGRCTRGAYMQMVEVDANIDCDYLVIVDTEGLKSAELSEFNHEHDNELGTLAVGIADLSIMNIGGENDAGMKDVLQIICYAFLRMTEGLKERPSCMMAHQNVGDIVAKQKTNAGKVKFFQTLDEMTQVAAASENKESKYKRFEDVIKCDPKRNDMYIPGLWQGSPPMAPVNIDYSEAAVQMRKAVVKEASIKENNPLHLLATRIKDVFSAVKEENFIFSFQNTYAAKLYQGLAKDYEREKWQIKTKLLDWMGDLETKLRHAKNYSYSIRVQTTNSCDEVISSSIQMLERKLNQYFSDNEEHASLLEHNRCVFENDISETKKQMMSENHKKIEDMFLFLRHEEKYDNVVKNGEEHFMPTLLKLKDKYLEAEKNLREMQKKNLQEDFWSSWSTAVQGIQEISFGEDHTERVMIEWLCNDQKEIIYTLPELTDNTLVLDVSEEDITSKGANFWTQKNKPAQLRLMVEEAQGKVNTIFRRCTKVIEEQCAVPKVHTDDDFHQIITFTRQETDYQNQNSTFSFSPALKKTVLLSVCSYACSNYKQNQEVFRESQQHAKQLEGSEDKYYALLVSSVDTKKPSSDLLQEIECGIIPEIEKDVLNFQDRWEFFKNEMARLNDEHIHSRKKQTEKNIQALKNHFDDAWISFLQGIEQSDHEEEADIEVTMVNCLRNHFAEHCHHFEDGSVNELNYAVKENDLVSPSEDQIRKAQDATDGILESCRIKVEEETKIAQKFREDVCYKIISFAKDLVDGSTNESSPFSTYYTVNLTRVVCLYASGKLIEMQRKFSESQDPRRKLAKSKSSYYNLLLSMVSMEDQVNVFCEEIASVITANLQRKLYVFLRNTINNKKLELCNCQQIQLSMMMKLHKENKFEGYRRYLVNFQSYCCNWIRSEVRDFLGENVSEGSTRFIQMMMEEAAASHNDLVKVVTASTKDALSYDAFVSSFQEACRESNGLIGLSDECVRRLKMIPVKEVEKFMGDLRQHLEKDILTLVKRRVENLDIDEELGKFSTPVELQLYKELFCKDGAQCPFCGAPCTVIGPHSEHRVDMHQPKGLIGWKDQNTRALDISECPLSLAYNKYFNAEDNKIVKFREYKKYYPTWSIPLDADPPCTKYWRMVLMNFNVYFANLHAGQPACIPDSWKNYNWHAIKEDLEKYYER